MIEKQFFYKARAK